MLLLGMIMFAVGTFLALEYSSISSRQLKAQLKRAASYAVVDHREKELSGSARERLIAPLIERLSHMAMRMSPAGSRLMLGRQLQAAGVTASPQVFLAVKGGFTVGGIGFGILGALVLQEPAMIMIGIIVSAFSFIGPGMYLGRKARGRREEMELRLADTLDLLTVSIEAGLGFDAAVLKVCEKMDGPLIDELDVMAREIRMGESRRNALRNMSSRIDSKVVGSFCRSIIQSEELGTSLGRTLRVQAVDMRIKRQLEAEEKAMKAPVKMLFPTVLFIFPAMFIVILGPAGLSIIEGMKGVNG